MWVSVVPTKIPEVGFLDELNVYLIHELFSPSLCEGQGSDKFVEWVRDRINVGPGNLSVHKALSLFVWISHHGNTV